MVGGGYGRARDWGCGSFEGGGLAGQFRSQICVLGLVVLALPGTLTSTRPDEDRVPSGPRLEVLGPRNWASRSDSRAN